MDRTKEIIKTSIIGIVTNILLSLTKILIGLISHSVAIVMDGINNMTDAMSSVITLIGTKLSEKAPDRKHPFGYGRLETVSSLFIGIIILYAGLDALQESVKRILNPVACEYTSAGIIAICIALLVKISLGLYTKNKGRKAESESLIASGRDALNDSMMSAATILSAFMYMSHGINIEAIVGAAISLFVIRTGIESIRTTVSDILGERVSAELIRKIKSSIMSFPDVDGVYDIALHNYGKGRMIGSAHIEVSDAFKTAWIDNLQRSICRKVYEDTGVDMMGVSVYAVNSREGVARDIRESVRQILETFDEVISMHGFYYDRTDNAIRFDVVTDFDVRDRDDLARRITEQVSGRYPDCSVDVTVNYEITDQ